MACSQIHFDIDIIESNSVSPQPQLVTLTKTSIVHIINQDPCGAPLNICIERVVECQSGCAIQTIMHDFPIDGCDPILPPGKYSISVPETLTMYKEDITIGMDIIFEEVSQEYVQAIIANKIGGCS